MTTSGSFITNDAPIESGSTYPKYAKTTWTASYDTASMQWTVTWSTTAQGGSTSGKWTTVQNGTTSFSSSNTLTPANPSASMSSRIDAHNDDVLTSGSFKVAINAGTGDASFTASMSYHFNSTGSSGLCEATQTFNLDNIPLASTITTGASSMNITSSSVSALSYTIRSKADFYHELKYGISESSATTKLSAQRINNTTYSGTITIAEILAKFPATTSGTLYLYLYTYKESAKTHQVGSTQIVAVTISISKGGTGIKPTITLGNIAVNNSPISGYLVAGYSSAKATVSGASPSSSTISRIAYTITASGSTNGSINASSGTITTNTLSPSLSNYTLTISATVYDARGGTATASKTATVYGYAKPKITANIYRTSASSGSSPARDDAGTNVYISFSSSQTKTVNGQNSIQSTVCTASGNITGTQTSGTYKALAVDKTARFTIVATDKVSSTTTIVDVSAAKFALELYDDKNGTLWAKTGGDLIADGGITAGEPIVAGGESRRYPGFRMKGASDANYAGAVFMNYGTNAVDSYSSPRLEFEIPSPTSAGSLTGKHEYYSLPAPDVGRTGDASYDILTSKSPVTVEQGGTGATTAANARANLEVKPSYSWTLSSGVATSFNIPNNSRHAIFVVGSAATRDGLFLLRASSSGAVSVSDVYKGSALSHTHTTNNFTITATGGVATIMFMTLIGSLVTKNE